MKTSAFAAKGRRLTNRPRNPRSFMGAWCQPAGRGQVTLCGTHFERLEDGALRCMDEVTGVRSGPRYITPRCRFCFTSVDVERFPGEEPGAGAVFVRSFLLRSFLPPEVARLSCRIFTRSIVLSAVRRGGSLDFSGRLAILASMSSLSAV